MKINEVEQKVGITKKNIRFYEEQGLIHPKRNASNGYRNYSKEDVSELYKIKLLRKLSVPIKEIHRVQMDEISFKKCMENHLLKLFHEKRELELMQNMCEQILSQEINFSDVNALSYLEQMDQMEEGGIQFMNIQEKDRTRQKVGPWIAALTMTLFMVLFMGIVVFAELMEPLPLIIFIVIMCIPGVIIVGTFIALFQRIREIEGGEQDEAVKY
ncbi:MAG: MerR family transcriptional regulator [Lachnospiraceae bacterium]|nr:MerR family transcriptional regulator [Lachnospiraceae bacterium]